MCLNSKANRSEDDFHRKKSLLYSEVPTGRGLHHRGPHGSHETEVERRRRGGENVDEDLYRGFCGMEQMRRSRQA